MATKDWKSLEGKPWRLDVGSTQKEALSATNPAILHVTTEQSMVMNGEVVASGKPTLQTSVTGSETNYVYSNSSEKTHCILSGVFKAFQSGGKCYILHKYWGSTSDYADGQYSTSEVPFVTTSANGVFEAVKLARLHNTTLKEVNSTSSVVNISYPDYSNGGTKTLAISAATTAKAGVMTAADKTKLDNLTAYARDLGNFKSEEAALDALKDIEISSNSNIVHVHCTYANGAMSITMMQSIENDYCRQIIFNKSKLYQRAIYFTNGERTEISYAEDWSFLSGDRLSWDSENNKYSLCAFGTAFNQAYCDPIPTATANNDGLMSAADKQKLDNVPTNTKAKLKKLSNPDFKVVVRKAIPLHPRKGMKYFFDNDIRFSIPRKYIVDAGNTITVPNDGKTYYTIPSTNGGSQMIIPNGTIINKDNYDTYFILDSGTSYTSSQVLCCKTSMPALVTIKKEGFSLEANTIRVSNLSEQLCFDTYSLYRKVEANKVVFDIPLPSVRVGDSINNDDHYLQFFKEKRKTFGVFNNDKKFDFIMDKGQKYYGKRICKIKDIKVLKTKHGVFYVSKTIVNKRKRWSHRFSNYNNYGPKLKIIIENGVIKKRM